MEKLDCKGVKIVSSDQKSSLSNAVSTLQNQQETTEGKRKSVHQFGTSSGKLLQIYDPDLLHTPKKTSNRC